MKTCFYFLIMIALMLSACQNDHKPEDLRPNIVLLLADDLGYGELGAYGQEIIKTPHLDELAGKGLIFTNFYAGNSVCSPSRAVLLTGRSSGHVPIRGNAGYFGNDKWSGVALDKDEYTLGEMFREAGYHSAFIGKWHLDNPDDVRTWATGHDFDFAAQEQWSGRFGTRDFSSEGLWVNGDQELFPYDFNKHDCKDAFYTNFALDFLDERDTSKPFFLFMSYRAPHSFEGPMRDTLSYANESWPKVEQAHAAKIFLQDRQVGRLLKYLEDIGELDNTLVLYTSDNGAHFAPGGHDLEFFNSNGNLKGGKRDLYEGGVRVPLIVYWNGKVEQGTTTDHIAGFQDIMPTFAEVIGIETPTQTDGISFKPLLLGQEQKKHDFLNYEFQLSGWFQTLPHGGFRQSVRMGNWKAVRYGVDLETELYNLDTDISESENVAGEHPEIVEKMNHLFETSRTETPGFPYGGVVQDYKSQDRYQAEDE